jgi:hypothetical protein
LLHPAGKKANSFTSNISYQNWCNKCVICIVNFRLCKLIRKLQVEQIFRYIVISNIICKYTSYLSNLCVNFLWIYRTHSGQTTFTVYISGLHFLNNCSGNKVYDVSPEVSYMVRWDGKQLPLGSCKMSFSGPIGDTIYTRSVCYDTVSYSVTNCQVQLEFSEEDGGKAMVCIFSFSAK